MGKRQRSADGVLRCPSSRHSLPLACAAPCRPPNAFPRNERVQCGGRSLPRFRITEQLARLLIRHADANELEGHLIDVRRLPELPLLDADRSGASDGLPPVPLRLHHGIADLAGAVVILLREREEDAARTVATMPTRAVELHDSSTST